MCHTFLILDDALLQIAYLQSLLLQCFSQLVPFVVLFQPLLFEAPVYLFQILLLLD